jgi:hypothetical protein
MDHAAGLAAVRENAIRTARLKQSPASIRVALKFSLAEAVIDAAVKAIAPPHEPQATPLGPDADGVRFFCTDR